MEAKRYEKSAAEFWLPVRWDSTPYESVSGHDGIWLSFDYFCGGWVTMPTREIPALFTAAITCITLP